MTTRRLTVCLGCRQLLWRIDQGEAVQIAGIPDPQLHLQLDALFVNINLAKTSKVGSVHPVCSVIIPASVGVMVLKITLSLPRAFMQSALAAQHA